MENKLCFSVYGELYVVDLDRMLYFEADDHYTHVYYSSGTHFMIPFGLAKVEAALSNKGSFIISCHVVVVPAVYAVAVRSSRQMAFRSRFVADRCALSLLSVREDAI